MTAASDIIRAWRSKPMEQKEARSDSEHTYELSEGELKGLGSPASLRPSEGPISPKKCIGCGEPVAHLNPSFNCSRCNGPLCSGRCNIVHLEVCPPRGASASPKLMSKPTEHTEAIPDSEHTIPGVAAPVSDSASAVEPCQTTVHKRSWIYYREAAPADDEAQALPRLPREAQAEAATLNSSATTLASSLTEDIEAVLETDIPVMKCSPCPLCTRRCTGHTRRRITAGLVDAYCTHGLPRMGVHEWTTMWKQSHSSDAESGSAPIGAASEEPSRMETEDARELLVALNFEDEAAPGEAAAPGSASCLAGAALLLEDQGPAAAGGVEAIALAFGSASAPAPAPALLLREDGCHLDGATRRMAADGRGYTWEAARQREGSRLRSAAGMEDRDSPNADVFREITAAVKRSPQDIERDMQHSEGAAFHAAILVGKEALAKGKPKHEVAAVIESAGANVCGLEKWRRSDFILMAEADLIGTRAQRFGTPQEQADLEYIATGHWY